MVEEGGRSNWLILGAVLVTVLAALLLSQLDLVRQVLPVATSVANVSGPTETPTPLPVVTLPSATPEPTLTQTAVSPAQEPSSDATPLSPTPDATRESGAAVPPLACGSPPSSWVRYTVQSGDTLFGLSIRSGATIEEVMQANCLSMRTLFSGTHIFLPSAPPRRPPCGPPSSWVQYTVQRGDTMYSLARTRGTTVYGVLQANCLSTTAIQAGRQLYLPPLPATATPVPPPTNTAVPSATNTAVPTNTVVPTATSTVTVTGMPTATVTSTPTSTPTLGASPTPTATPGGTATATPTNTAVPTNTATPTNTAVPTSSPTPTNTAVPTNTPTTVPTATPTNTPAP